MQFTGYRMSSLASSERRNGTMNEFADWRSAEVTALDEGDTVVGKRSEPDECHFRSDNGDKCFGKEKIREVRD